MNKPGLYRALLCAGLAPAACTGLAWTAQTGARADLVCTEGTGACVGLAVAEEAGVRLSLRL